MHVVGKVLREKLNSVFIEGGTTGRSLFSRADRISETEEIRRSRRKIYRRSRMNNRNEIKARVKALCFIGT